MRVVHIVSSLRGGAGIAARRLSEALNAAGVQSAIVCRSGASDAPDAIAVDGEHGNLADEAAQRVAWLFEEAVQDAYIAPNRSDMSNTLFTLDYAGIPIAQHEAVSSADIINLHWTSFFQSTDTLADLFALGKPIVWTLHDMNPFTGGCHYSAGCARFTETCAQCPQLSGDPADAAAAHLAERKAAYGNAPHLAVVSPSVWLANEARRSALFSGARVETISNCVDPAIFNANGRAAARQNLGVTDKTVCIGFAPLNRAERRKGFAELEAALSILATRTKGVDVRLVVMGEDAEKDKFAFPAIGVAAAEREADVAAVLSACDICVTPSLEDNLPNTILEAMACGLPVVAFDVGGAKDAIADGENGALVTVGDSAALAERLAALVTDTAKRQAMGQAARKRAEDIFAPKRQAAAYSALYKSLTKAAPKTPARPGHAKRVSENAPSGVLAAAWPTFMTYTAQAHQAALDQIERNRNWAEKTEENLGAARDRAAGFKDWAKRSDATLAETKALLEKTRQWALESEEALAKQRAHGDEMEKWARKSDAALDERNTLLAQVQAWARNSDAALVQRTAELQEALTWARKSDAALAQRAAEMQEALTWARNSDALLAEKNALIEELKAWAEGAEARVGAGKTELAAVQTRQGELEAGLTELEITRAELERRAGELTTALAASEAELDRVSWSRRWQRLMKALNAPR